MGIVHFIFTAAAVRDLRPLVATRIYLALALVKSQRFDVNLLDSVDPIITETLQDEQVASGSGRALAGMGNARRNPGKISRAEQVDFSKSRLIHRDKNGRPNTP